MFAVIRMRVRRNRLVLLVVYNRLLFCVVIIVFMLVIIKFRLVLVKFLVRNRFLMIRFRCLVRLRLLVFGPDVSVIVLRFVVRALIRRNGNRVGRTSIR